MRLLFIADGRSPTALNWIKYFIQQEYLVHFVSSYPCQPPDGLASFTVLPVAFSGLKTTQKNSVADPQQRRGVWAGSWVSFRTAVRQWLGPATLPGASQQLARIIQHVQPDLVHAMRIPFEGMLATTCLKGLRNVLGHTPPLLVSIWGNDLTLHARANPWMAALTRQTLLQANALHTDCHRDQRLALKRGFPADRPAIVLPGGGGIQLDQFQPPDQKSSRLVINPRGVRPYVRNDTFFRAAAKIHHQDASVTFVCPNMADDRQAQDWVERLGLRGVVDLLPKVSRSEMAHLFQQAMVVASVTTHDGTPNSLLEALACGCFPVVGDIEPLREWIVHDENGFLVDPGDPDALAHAILQALSNPELQQQAVESNLRLVKERAEYGAVMRKAAAFYQGLSEQV